MTSKLESAVKETDVLKKKLGEKLGGAKRVRSFNNIFQHCLGSVLYSFLFCLFCNKSVLSASLFSAAVAAVEKQFI